MMRIRWTMGLAILLGVFCMVATAPAATAAKKKTERTTLKRRPSAALLMRLAKAQQLSTQPRTFKTQVGVAVAARRHADAIERKKRTLDILNNQYLRGTSASTPSESEIRQTIGTLESQLNAQQAPENAHEIQYYLAACYESLGDIPKAQELLQGIVAQHGSNESPTVKSFVAQANADLERLGGAPAGAE